MLTLEQVALELLEYKLEALTARRPVKGGIAGLWELHRVIERSETALSDEERPRLADLGRRLRALSDLPGRDQGRQGDLASLTLEQVGLDTPRGEGEALLSTDTLGGAEPSREVRDEQRTLQRLAERIWREQLDEVVARMAAAWRAERDRLTPRLVYATLRNLQRYAEATQGGDHQLRGFKVVEAVPEREDSLISLSDLDSLGEVGRELVDLILNLGTPASPFPGFGVPEAQALPFVRQAMMVVAEDPYAGRLSSLPRRGPTTQELRTAIQELGKERLPEAQRTLLRRDLEARLTDALAFERQQRQTFQRDATRNLDAMAALFARLERQLPARVGGEAPSPRLAGGVLFAHTPVLRWDKVPSGAVALTMRLVGPVRFTLGGHAIAVMGSGDSRTLFVDDQAHPLENKMLVRAGRGEIRVDREADYLHVRWRDGARSLAARLAQALLLAHVQTHERGGALTEVLTAMGGLSGGGAEEAVARALLRATEVTERAPNRRAAVEGLVLGAARAVGVTLEENVAQGLVQRLLTALTAEAGDLAGLLEREDRAEGAAYSVGEEPVTADLGPLKLTLRRYRARGKDANDQLVVMLPGQVVGSFDDTAVEAVPGGVLVCARGGSDVALLYLQDRSLRTRRTSV